MPRINDELERELVRVLLSKIKKDSIPVESMVSVSYVFKIMRRERLIRQIAWFLMVTIASTLMLLVIQSLGVLILPPHVAERLWILFSVQTVALLAVIVRQFTKVD